MSANKQTKKHLLCKSSCGLWVHQFSGTMNVENVRLWLIEPPAQFSRTVAIFQGHGGTIQRYLSIRFLADRVRSIVVTYVFMPGKKKTDALNISLPLDCSVIPLEWYLYNFACLQYLLSFTVPVFVVLALISRSNCNVGRKKRLFRKGHLWQS